MDNLNTTTRTIEVPDEMPPGLQETIERSQMAEKFGVTYLIWKKRGSLKDENTRASLSSSFGQMMPPEIRVYWVDVEPFSVRFTFKQHLVRMRMSLEAEDGGELRIALQHQSGTVEAIEVGAPEFDGITHPTIGHA